MAESSRQVFDVVGLTCSRGFLLYSRMYSAIHVFSHSALFSIEVKKFTFQSTLQYTHMY